MLLSMRSQRVGHNLRTKQQQQYPQGPDWRGLKQRTLGIEGTRELKDGKCP